MMTRSDNSPAPGETTNSPIKLMQNCISCVTKESRQIMNNRSLFVDQRGRCLGLTLYFVSQKSIRLYHSTGLYAKPILRYP